MTAGADRQVLVWRAADGRQTRSLRGHFNAVEQAAFSPSGRWVVTADPGVASSFDLSNGQRLLFLGGHTGKVPVVRLRRRAADRDGRHELYNFRATTAIEICGGAASW